MEYRAGVFLSSFPNLFNKFFELCLFTGADMPMDLELERLREERLKEMKEKQGFVDIRSVVDVRDSGIVRNKEVVSLSIP